MPVSQLGIAEMSAVFGVSFRTLRFYEEQGLLSPAKYAGVSRHYGPADQVRVQLILKAKRLGFTIKDIRELIGIAQDTNNGAPEGDVVDHLSAQRLKAKIDELVMRRDTVQSAIEALTKAYRECPDD